MAAPLRHSMTKLSSQFCKCSSSNFMKISIDSKRNHRFSIHSIRRCSLQASSGIDIGLPSPPKTKEIKQKQKAIILQQRKKDQLEQDSRHRKLLIPLDEVWKDWETTLGPHHIKEVARHYNIFQDLFDGAEFSSYVPLRINYECEDGGYMPVHRGNVITPTEALKAPSVSYESEGDTLWTLLMTNPDGHLLDNESEYCHWLIGNIPGEDINKGDLIYDYLPVFPAKGTGYHRVVFILFKQEERLDFKDEKVELPCLSLQERTFRTFDFYKKYEDVITPAGLHFAQCRWDSSVKQIFHNILDMREPIFTYDAPKMHLMPQQKWPYKKTINYLKQYMKEE